MQRTRKLSGDCSDGTCPRIDETDQPDVIAVQGRVPSAADLAAFGPVPEGEAVILIPRRLLKDGARALP